MVEILDLVVHLEVNPFAPSFHARVENLILSGLFPSPERILPNDLADALDLMHGGYSTSDKAMKRLRLTTLVVLLSGLLAYVWVTDQPAPSHPQGRFPHILSWFLLVTVFVGFFLTMGREIRGRNTIQTRRKTETAGRPKP